MLRLEGEAAQMVGVLHDLVEDTDTLFDDLRALGYAEDLVQALDCLTHRPDETYEQYVERAAANPLARRVKRADRKITWIFAACRWSLKKITSG